MAKSPRKASKYTRKKSVARSVASKNPRPPMAGKNASKYFNYYSINNNIDSRSRNGLKKRRFSIAESSSSSSGSHSGSDDDSVNSSNGRGYHTSGGKRFDKYGGGLDVGDSDSSLTAVSEEDEIEASRRGSLFEDFSPRKSKLKSKTSKPRYAKKRAPKKTFNWKPGFDNDGEAVDFDEDDDDNSDEQDSDENSDESDENSDSETEAKAHLRGLYAILNQQQTSDADSDSQSGANDDDDDDEEEDEEEYGYSSSDDSEVDFVKLQAEHKKKSMKAVKAMNAQTSPNSKMTKKEKRKSMSEGGDKKSNIKKRNSIAKSKSKFGRRKSEVALPEDINFTFDFDDFNDKEMGDVKDDPFDQLEFPKLNVDAEKTDAFNEEEDIGEEVTTPDKGDKNSSKDSGADNDMQFDFEFDSQLLPVPKFKEGDLNSDEDYEIDDNELVATLQADDEDDLINDGSVNHTRNNSIGSIEDDKDSAFLKEEEAYLVNEFESNGFDEDGQIDIDDVENRNLIANGLNHFQDDDNDQVLQYASSDDMDDNDMEDDDYIDFVNFEIPFFENSDNETSPKKSKKKPTETTSSTTSATTAAATTFGNKSALSQLQSHRKHKRKDKKLSGLDVTASDDEDDSYLWNYFFSSENESNGSASDAESESEGLLHAYDSDDELLLSDDNNKSRLIDKNASDGLTADKQNSPTNNLNKRANGNEYPTGLGEFSEYEYDSGESTDEDLNLPKSSKSKVGSKVAKEVLSSKTADHRPPVLGTWAAVSNKPFGIIDGLSTRSLITKPFDPKQKPRTAFPIISNQPDVDDALGLDELLNVSELDDADENDIRIWRDFSNQKRHVPLGAFRNKSILQNNNRSSSGGTGSNVLYSGLYAQHDRRRNGPDSGKKSQSKGETIADQQGSGGVHKSGRRKSSAVGPLSHHGSKSTRRRASIVEALSEGLRPTKSGLFSEAALADVEETFGDDVELMSLIRGI